MGPWRHVVGRAVAAHWASVEVVRRACCRGGADSLGEVVFSVDHRGMDVGFGVEEVGEAAVAEEGAHFFSHCLERERRGWGWEGEERKPVIGLRRYK